jgi:hypothetical protein
MMTTTTSRNSMSKNSCRADDVSVDLFFSSSNDYYEICSAAINDPELPRQGVKEENKEGSLASGQVLPSVAKEATHTGPKVVAAPKGLIILRVIPLKKSLG